MNNLQDKKREIDSNLDREIERNLKEKNFHQAKRLQSIKEYYLKKDSLRSADRLEPVGNPGSIMFVGLNPAEGSNMRDAWDDLFGKELKGLLKLAGIDHEVVWLTNLWKKQTPNNRPLDRNEIVAGLRELDVEIYAMDPTLIVMLGNQVIDALGGTKYEYGSYKGYKTFGMSHPSFIKRYAREDIKKEFMDSLISIKKHV